MDAKHKTVIGKLYSDGCIHCIMMSKAWQDMCAQIKRDMKLVESKDVDKKLSNYTKYVSPDGNHMVEIIEIEANNMDKELPHVKSKYSPEIDLQGGFPTLFKVRNNVVSYYGGERTAEKMKKWYMMPVSGGNRNTRRNKRKNKKTKKNTTRARWLSAAKSVKRIAR